MKKAFTQRQGEYLAFLAQFREIAGAAASETDVANFFGVSGPSAHQMMVTLEKRGLISRQPGVARSAEVIVSKRQLPVLDGRGEPRRDRFEAVVDFAVYVGTTLVADRPSLARAGAVALMAERLARILKRAKVPLERIEQAQDMVFAVARLALRGSRAVLRPGPPVLSGSEPAAAKRRAKPRREPPAGQGSLFEIVDGD